MARSDEKGKRFEFLVGRIDEAIDDKYYVEAMALTYSLFEERTYKLLERLNISRKNSDKIYQCLIYFKDHVINKTISVTPCKCSLDELTTWLQKEFLDSGLIDNIQIWRNKRNDVIHDLAKQNIEYKSLEITAKEGRDYFRIYTALIMKLKKLI